MGFIKNIAVLIITFLVSLHASSHGEDKWGPNGGYVRMPGDFHTELLQISDQKFRVYLLDVNWQNPSVKDSTVKANVKFKSEKIKINCRAEANYFSCELPRAKTLKLAKQISLKATREKSNGILVSYELPLKLITHPESNNVR